MGHQRVRGNVHVRLAGSPAKNRPERHTITRNCTNWQSGIAQIIAVTCFMYNSCGMERRWHAICNRFQVVSLMESSEGS